MQRRTNKKLTEFWFSKLLYYQINYTLVYLMKSTE